MYVHAARSMKISVVGKWHLSGPQLVSDAPGNAPAWLEEAFKDPKVEMITVHREGAGGVCYTRLSERTT